MQRVRLGLTGLAFVFLTIMIAMAALRSDRVGTVSPPPQGETLAMLGVAPSAEPAAVEAVRAPAARPAPAPIVTAPFPAHAQR